MGASMESRLYVGDAVGVLQSLPAEIAQTCVTSPPYFGLRDYGTATWEGGDAACDHAKPVPKGGKSTLTNWAGKSDAQERYAEKLKSTLQYRDLCGKCGARRIDSQIGLEETPEAYVAKLVDVFREVRRVLRDDGTLWLNLGDSYATAPAGNKTWGNGIKSKDLYGIPWLVAFALRADGWYLRSDIIWAKPNPMPESVKDRPTKSHEYVFLLSQQPKYYYDAASIAEPATTEKGTRNKRGVWVVLPKPYKPAHFATFPSDLIKPCILAGSREGDVVIDPFMGSGTTAVVAASLGRRYIGIDINPEYITMAEERVRNGK